MRAAFVVTKIHNGLWGRGSLYAGRCPMNPEELYHLRREVGIRYVVSFLEPHEVKSYAAWSTITDGLSIVQMPVPDMCSPAPEYLESILARIDSLLNKGHNVYIHCLAGRGRTGVIAGCWFVLCGMTAEGALRKTKKLLDGPLTKGQRKAVREFARSSDSALGRVRELARVPGTQLD